MDSGFDPYHKWLAIPPQEQPADHYRLLGIRRFEDDREVISNAVDQRMAFLRTFQIGPRGGEAEALLNHMASARVCLLDQARKAAYDAVLRSATHVDAGEGAPVHPPTTMSPVATPPPADPVSGTPLQNGPLQTDSQRSSGEMLQAGELRGQRFGHFELMQCLQRSKLAVVYQAKHLPTGRLHTVKLLPTEAAADARLRKRFQREVDITTQLEHPNLIAGFEGGEWQGMPYLVTEYVVGTDLMTVVGQQGPLSLDHGLELIEQATRGLMQLHLLGVLHRNVAPKNLLVDLQGRLKITNLFFARVQDGFAMQEAKGEELTTMGETMGSVEFLAPEQALDAASVDARADVYGLGCTLFYLLTGRPVYGGRSLMDKLVAHKTQPIPSLRTHCPAAPAWLGRLFRRMVAKDPGGRCQSMGEVLAAIQEGRQPPWFLQIWRSLFPQRYR